jgi:hypothetical protein
MTQRRRDPHTDPCAVAGGRREPWIAELQRDDVAGSGEQRRACGLRPNHQPDHARRGAAPGGRRHGERQCRSTRRSLSATMPSRCSKSAIDSGLARDVCCCKNYGGRRAGTRTSWTSFTIRIVTTSRWTSCSSGALRPAGNLPLASYPLTACRECDSKTTCRGPQAGSVGELTLRRRRCCPTRTRWQDRRGVARRRCGRS